MKAGGSLLTGESVCGRYRYAAAGPTADSPATISPTPVVDNLALFLVMTTQLLLI